MKTLTALAGAVVLMGAASAANAAAILPSSYYSDYNTIVFGDYKSQDTDSEASVAVKGNAELTSYGVGTHQTGGKLNVGGDLIYNNGNVSNGTGSINVGGSANLSGVGFASTGPNTFDFDEAYNTLSHLSTAVKNSSTPSSTVTNSPSGGITLTGTHTDSNTFNVTAAQFGSGALNFVVPTGATILVNVSGSTVSFGQGQATLNGVNMVQADGRGIIYNFTEASTIYLYSTPVYGTILGLNAALAGASAQVNGQVFVGSYNGQVEFHNQPFTGVVPVPAALPLMASALVGLGLVKRFGRAKDANLAA